MSPGFNDLIVFETVLSISCRNISADTVVDNDGRVAKSSFGSYVLFIIYK